MPHCNRQDRSLPDDRDCGKPERLEKVRSGAACETKHETLGTAMIVQRSVVIMSIAALLGLPLPAEGQAPPESLLRVGARVRYRVPDGSRPYTGLRSEERRVGKECRSRRAPSHEEKKQRAGK